jgi:Xaa-Pro aminopeptidase
MERKAYTLVLKGHIALDVAIFPKGTTGFALDTLARQFLWVRHCQLFKFFTNLPSGRRVGLPTWYRSRRRLIS